ncbi:MAG: hypothetical protein R3B49_06105 [Phycisphaerales bacterium]
MRRATLVVIGLTLAGAPAAAQDSTPDKPSADPVLGGPKVEEDAGQATIVERGFDGEMRSAQGPAELAALEKLDLDEGTRAAVRAALDERAAIVDGILADHLGLFMKVRGVLQSMRSGGERRMDADARAAMTEFREVITPLTARGPLREEIARLLPDGARDQFEAMLREHDEAMMAQRRAEMGDRAPGGDRSPDAMTMGERPADAMGEGSPEDRRGARRGGQRGGMGAGAGAERAGAFRSYFAEFRDSYDRVVGQRQADFEANVQRLGLTPEQVAILRSTTREVIGDVGPNSTQEQRRAAFEAFLGKLPADERREVLRKMREMRTNP